MYGVAYHLNTYDVQRIRSAYESSSQYFTYLLAVFCNTYGIRGFIDILDEASIGSYLSKFYALSVYKILIFYLPFFQWTAKLHIKTLASLVVVHIVKSH